MLANSKSKRTRGDRAPLKENNDYFIFLNN